jgi:hypothetical protein
MWRTLRFPSADEPQGPAHLGVLMGAMRPIVRLVQVRLRIPAILLLTALVVGRWDELRNRWDKLTRFRTPENAAMHAVMRDVEYFCPMDPGVVSAWPGKCGVCHMGLVTRKKGDTTILPDGVIARMQLSPYRVQLAGILTAPAEFRPLERIHEVLGVVDREGKRAKVRTEVAAMRAPWVAAGQAVEIRSRDLPGLGPWAGKVVAVTRHRSDDREILRIEVAVEDDADKLRPGMSTEVSLRVAAAELEPFCSQPSGPPPRRGDEPVQVYACPDHADSIGLVPGRCSEDHASRVMRVLDNQQRLRWWCPMHPEVTSDRAGTVCSDCGGMALRPRIVTYRPPGQVLGVPESAVVDNGGHAVVIFVESMPGMFDAVEVVLGPRCGDHYPVVRGLEAGQRIVIAGTFLLDAETRLNPSLATGYFGAARRQAEAPDAPGILTPMTRAVAAEAKVSALESLPPGDREQARRQGPCPVTRKPLGSMGTPVRIEINGRVVFLCCSGCEDRLRSDPARYLARPSNAGTDRP